MVNQHLLEMMCSVAPILMQIKSKKRSNYLTTPVRKPSCVIELTHTSVDKRHTCPAITPSFYSVHITVPLMHCWLIYWSRAIFVKQFRAFVSSVKNVEVPDKQMSCKELGAEGLGLNFLDGVVDCLR